jgi:hypothetical protein
MGMELWGAISQDGGYEWSESRSILPAALLPNQTSAANFNYWCEQSIWQRAIGSLSVLQLNSSIWAVGQTTDFFCWGDLGSGTRGAGRIARQISSVNGSTIGDPCWLEQNSWTNTTLYNETIYGTKYNMAICDSAAEMNAMLEEPSLVPAWSDWLYNNELHAGDTGTILQENTHAVWIKEGQGYWQRFWRDISAENSKHVWVEVSPNVDGTKWYPVVEEELGNMVRENAYPYTFENC